MTYEDRRPLKEIACTTRRFVSRVSCRMWGPNQGTARPRHDGKSFYLPSASAGHGDTHRSVVVPHGGSCDGVLNMFVPQNQLDVVSTEGDGTVHALLTRFRIENERLREQVKAHVVQETLLMQRLQELSARNTALHLQEFRKMENDAVTERLKKQLEAKDMEVRTLQLQVGELSGRIAAYEEAISRTDGTTECCENSTERVRELICEALSSVGFLTRVANAVEHCHPSTHGGTGCPRSLEECTKRCLQAAMRGNDEVPGEMVARGHRVSCEQLAAALREDVLMCEMVAVRVAAKIYTERSCGDNAFTDRQGIHLSAPQELTSPLVIATSEPDQDTHEPSQKTPKVRRRRANRPSMENCEVQ